MGSVFDFDPWKVKIWSWVLPHEVQALVNYNYASSFPGYPEYNNIIYNGMDETETVRLIVGTFTLLPNYFIVVVTDLNKDVSWKIEFVGQAELSPVGFWTPRKNNLDNLLFMVAFLHLYQVEPYSLFLNCIVTTISNYHHYFPLALYNAAESDPEESDLEIEDTEEEFDEEEIDEEEFDDNAEDNESELAGSDEESDLESGDLASDEEDEN